MTMRSTWKKLVPALLGLTALAACVPETPVTPGPTTTTAPTTTTTTTPPPPKFVLYKGHADAFEVTVDGNALEVQIKDDSGLGAPGTVFRDPAETILQALPTSSVPGGAPGVAPFTFLGAAGSPLWLLPQVQDANLLWPGLSTERISSGVLQGNKVTWTVDSVTGPGAFHLFQNDSFGSPVVWFTSNNAWPQSKQVNTGQHAHFNWAFGASGTYTLTFRATATLANGTPVTSGPVPYTFVVGSLPA